MLSVRPQLAEGRRRQDLDPALLLGSGARDALPFPLSGDEMEVTDALRRFNPLAHRTKGYVIRHADMPELLALLRTKACVVETPRTAATPVETRPLEPVLWMDYDDEGALEVHGEFQLPDSATRLAPREVEEGGAWVRIGDGFYRAPRAIAARLEEILRQEAGTADRPADSRVPADRAAASGRDAHRRPQPAGQRDARRQPDGRPPRSTCAWTTTTGWWPRCSTPTAT